MPWEHQIQFIQFDNFWLIRNFNAFYMSIVSMKIDFNSQKFSKLTRHLYFIQWISIIIKICKLICSKLRSNAMQNELNNFF